MAGLQRGFASGRGARQHGAPLAGDAMGYHNRTGKHDVTDFDWAWCLDFADRHLKPAK